MKYKQSESKQDMRKISRRVKSKAEMEKTARKLLKEIKWLLHKFGESEGEKKEKYHQKIFNWYRAHPKLGEIVQEKLAKQLVERIGVEEAEKLLEERLKDEEQSQ